MFLSGCCFYSVNVYRESLTPWEVKTGDAVTNLDAQVQKGQTSVTVNVNEAIPVLGIRNADVNGFTGGEGIKPQISYNNAVDINGFNNGVTTVTLSVRDVSGSAIGTMTAPFSAAALSSWLTSDLGKMLPLCAIMRLWD